MKVKHIILNITASKSDQALFCYESIFGLSLLDHGWIKTFGTEETMKIQISVAAEGGSGTPVLNIYRS
ncbi:MAG: hypothetical protein MI864_17410 [Pseudomonadales bacterium]|nr:hypothetical protein [Pseudomonadales bacterium]